MEALLDTQRICIVQWQSCTAVCDSTGEAELETCKMGWVYAEFHICD